MSRIIVLSLFIGLVSNAFSQISHGGQPHSFQDVSLKTTIDYRIIEDIDTEKLLKEDALDEVDPDIPWRFGKDISVDFNLSNSGTWEVLANGDRIWRLEIRSYGASSINLIYRKFYMPEGASLFLYNDTKSHVIGSFTNENHKPDGSFATIPIEGDVCVLEYFEPSEKYDEGQLEISYVIHAYKDFYTNANKGFGSSGSCNINANCPEGDDWQTQKRGVAMVLTNNNTRKCTGSLINNTAYDGTPYFLTANHCSGGESTWIIMFNYESPSCDNVDGPTIQSVQFTTKRASNAASDFMLVELSEVPPLDYNVYYNGWDKVNSPDQQSVCIHHPRGDIKKISFDFEPFMSDKYLGNQGYDDSHWKIEQWDLGTTEPGSSGSPLFNTSKLIVGQLHGGTASCSSLSPDWYGKFSMSWNFGTQSNSRLMEWLDPLDFNPDFIDGFDPALNTYEINAAIISALEPLNNYSQEVEIAPTFIIRNMGNQAIESLQISYKMDDGELFSKSWNGHIELYDTAHIIFEEISLAYGEYQLLAFIDTPNGGDDEYLYNDTLTKTVNVDYNYDIAIKEFISPQGTYCSDEILKARFIVENVGYHSVSSITAIMQIDNEEEEEFEIAGIINPGATKNIIIGDIIPDELWHTLTLSIKITEEEDQNLSNNSIESEFTSFGNNISLRIGTDDNGDETSWQLLDENLDIIEEGGDYGDNFLMRLGFCLPVGCYTFNIFDEGGNGIQNGSGFNLVNSTTGIVLGSGSDFGEGMSVEFCVASELNSDFSIKIDSICINGEITFDNLSTGADAYLWTFEGGTPGTSQESTPTVYYQKTGVYDVSLKIWQGETSTETTKRDFITVLDCAGIDDVMMNQFNIIPNPSSGTFTVQLLNTFTVKSLRIINSIGESIFYKTMGSNSNQSLNLILEDGMYIVELETTDGFIRQKLLITK